MPREQGAVGHLPAQTPTRRRWHGYVVGMGNYSEMDHTKTINRMIEMIHNFGLRSGWRDRDAKGSTRNQLLGLRVHGALDRAAIVG